MAAGPKPMHEHMTTKEVAAYLRLNEKKVYALVAQGALPAARISGKWLFPKTLIDRWVAENTFYPKSGLMGALLDEMVVLQGSDDWLLSRLLLEVQEKMDRPIPSSSVGSLGGLRALEKGRAHLAGSHVDRKMLEETLGAGKGWYLLDLFERSQGLIFDASSHPELGEGLPKVRGLAMAGRQPSSGTHKLTERLLAESGIAGGEVHSAGTCSGHLEVALTVASAKADFGVGIEVAARRCDLSFLPLEKERFQLVLHADHFGHPAMQQLLDMLLSRLKAAATESPPGYFFERSGRLEPLS